MFQEMRTPRAPRPSLTSIGRAALATGGLYVLIVSAAPLLALLPFAEPGDPASPVVLDRNSLLLDFLLWAVYPAAVLLIAGWRLGTEPTKADRLLRASALVMCGYVAIGGLAGLLDPAAVPGPAVLGVGAAAAGAIGLAALVRWSAPAAADA